jgi:hypothetical protein
MKTAFAALVLLLSLLSAGCQQFALAAQNIAFEAGLCADRTCECVEYRQLAKEAWRRFHDGHPGQNWSDDFIDGFLDGYAHFLNEGRPDHAPPVPPARYWHKYYMSPEGHQAAEQWLNGYQAGTEAAQGSGRRIYQTVPYRPVLKPGQFPVVELPPPAPADGALPTPRILPGPESR